MQLRRTVTLRASYHAAPRRFLAAVLLAVGCTSGNDSTATTPAIAVTMNPAAVGAAAGGSAQAIATVTRTGGFSGAVTVTVEGLPTGVTAAISNSQTTGDTTTAVITLTAAGTTAPGVTAVTVRAHGTGVADATTLLTLTLTAAVPNFTLSTAPAVGLTIAQGFSAVATITVTRTLGFSGSVSFTVTGAPTGLTLSPAPASTTGTSSSFGLAASGTVTPGAYTLTIHGTATGLAEQTATLGVVIGAAGSGNASIDFSACAASGKPIWLATQDGSGPWTRGTGVADVYRFNVNASTGQVAWVTTSGANAFTVHQLLRLHDALIAAPQLICTASGTKTVNGTLANLATGLAAKLYLGGSGTSQSVNGAFQISGVVDGNQDLVAYARSTSTPGIADRVLLRRAVNIATGGTLGTVDMTGGESFAPIAATMTANGTLAGESTAYSVEYFTGAGSNGCQLAVLYGDNPTSGTFTAYGVPAAQQVATDFHALAFNASEAGGGAVRTIIQYFHAFAATTVTLPAVLPTPVFTSVGGPYRRLQAAFSMPADYGGTTQIQYGDASGPFRFVILTADGGAFGTQGGVLALQDFSGVAGWDNSWGPSAATSNWSLTGISTPPATACQEGGKLAFSQRFGTF